MKSSPNESVTWVPVKTRSADEKVPVLCLVGCAGPLTKSLRKRLVVFDDRLVLGRKIRNDDGVQAWQLDDRMASSQHAMIELAEDGYYLDDLDSTNGTIVDGRAVTTTATRLRDGALIFIGSHVFVFRLVSRQQLRAIMAELETPVGPVATCSPALAVTLTRLRVLSQTPEHILLIGETGTGKDVYANAVHRISGRTGPFVAVNCAAMPRELVESELFGYLRGAHSQATTSKPGLIEVAEGGTLFLDEIGEMSPQLQTKLLRFLQDRTVTPLGGTKSRYIDVRVVAASSTEIREDSSGSGIRLDLLARLGAEPIRLPALRYRIEDLGALITHFMEEPELPLSPTAFQQLSLYSWPGNTRELQLAIRAAQVLGKSANLIDLESLPRVISVPGARLTTPAPAPPSSVAPTAEELSALMNKFHGNMMKVSRALEHQPRVVYRWVKRYGLQPDAFRQKEPRT
jgi:transcriptional regulator with PAS, ATPase and Fis domain